MQPFTTPANHDPELWRLAKRRAKFKAHLFTYLWVNALLWAIWALTDRTTGLIPWPLWATVFWGVGIVTQALGTYGVLGQPDWTQREYERLQRRQ